MGWIFFLNNGKKNEVQNWIDGGCKPVEGSGVENQRGFEKILFPNKTSESKSEVQPRKVSLSPIRTDVDRVSQLENTVATLLQRLSLLEAEVKSLKGNQTKAQSPQSKVSQSKEEEYEFEEIEVEVEEQVEVPVKRLLRR